MPRTSGILATILIAFLSAGELTAQSNNFCMDCIQKRIERAGPDDEIWYEMDGSCCMLPCTGFEDYQLKDADVGSGCSTLEVNNELARGDICNSDESDKGCPEPPPDHNPPLVSDCAEGGNDPCHQGTPILLALGDGSYRLTSAPDGVQFDLRNEGRTIQTAWTRAGTDNAFLVLDRNGNGRIDSGAELFGNFTRLRSGQLAQNGFEALAELDDNGDAVIDAQDAAWSSLALWLDGDHNGVSAASELQPIAGSVVASIETGYQLVGRRDQWGNEFRLQSHFRMRKNGRRTYYDVFFRMAS